MSLIIQQKMRTQIACLQLASLLSQTKARFVPICPAENTRQANNSSRQKGRLHALI
jgi:hypothetical protein